jgi:hypothetical protein
MISLVNVLRAKVPAPAFAAALAKLGPNEQRLVESPPLAVTWLPLAQGDAIEKMVEDALGGDLDAVTEISAEAAQSDLRGIYRAFIKLASPQFVATRAGAIYSTYVRDAGAMRLVSKAEHSVEIVLEGYPLPSPRFYALRRGNILGAVRATGIGLPRCEIVGGGGHGASCLYRASWA